MTGQIDKKERLKKMNTEELLEDFEYVVERNHYDPMNSDTPEHTYHELRDEIVRRLSRD